MGIVFQNIEVDTSIKTSGWLSPFTDVCLSVSTRHAKYNKPLKESQ
jgi:hypothetical protein